MSVISAIFLMMVFLNTTTPMMYQEHLDLNDLYNLFNDDGCIEGTLSAMEMLGPVFRIDSSVNDLSHVSSSKETVNVMVEENINSCDDKSSLNLVYELARFNEIQHQYTLIDEKGPPHKKQFVISLKLGDDEYQAEDNSIKKAKRKVACLALNSTSYLHPPKTLIQDKPTKLSKTAVQKLSTWADKHSDAKVVYLFNEHSKYLSNFGPNLYHSIPENVHRVTVKINDEKFVGEGLSASSAKEIAATKALSELQNLHGLCMVNDKERNFFAQLFGHDSEAQNPISIIDEFGSKAKLKVLFNLISEEGPAHMKKFTFKCNVGDFESFGEGSSKKAAKSDAAVKMVAILKVQASYSLENCNTILKKNKNRKKKKRNNLIKAVVQTSYPDESYDDVPLSDNIDPISKLYQVQQNKQGLEPVFMFLEDKSESKKEFSFKVTVGTIYSVGHGPNKKSAKRNAAEKMLVKLGYTTETEKTHFATDKQKKQNFINNHNHFEEKSIGPGIKINLEKHPLVNTDKKKLFDNSKAKRSENIGEKNFKHTSNSVKPQSKTNEKSSSMQPKRQLNSLSEQLGFKYQFSDFPAEKNLGFISLLSLTTKPPKICHGIGETVELSQDRAALTALENLYKSELETISQIMRKPADTKLNPKQENIKPFITLEKY